MDRRAFLGSLVAVATPSLVRSVRAAPPPGVVAHSFVVQTWAQLSTLHGQPATGPRNQRILALVEATFDWPRFMTTLLRRVGPVPPPDPLALEGRVRALIGLGLLGVLPAAGNLPPLKVGAVQGLGKELHGVEATAGPTDLRFVVHVDQQVGLADLHLDDVSYAEVLGREIGRVAKKEGWAAVAKRLDARIAEHRAKLGVPPLSPAFLHQGP
ncbi:MAG: hypothetical protein JNL79_25255 [Myxococcales bacterium]|nr:hypothetical protein [Myxococcales bacterium]